MNHVRIPESGLRELHLFAGAGGGILGGILCGHTPVCAVEIDPYCRKVLLQRQRDRILPRFPIWDDIKTFDGTPWRRIVDLVCGGFPCQDISSAGKGTGITGERSGLWSEMARCVRDIRPRFVLVENSPFLVSRGIGVVLRDLSQMGYDAEWGVISASDAIWTYGTPRFDHERARIWIKATLRNADSGRHLQSPAIRQYQSDQDRPVETSEQGRSRESGKTESAGETVGNRVANRDELRRDVRGFEGKGIYWPDQTCREVDSSGEAVTDRDSIGEQQPQGGVGEKRRRAGDGIEVGATADTTVEFSKRSWRTWRRGDQSPDGGWWAVEPGVGRMVAGLVHRVDRIRAIGNGQVPAVVERAWETLK